MQRHSTSPADEVLQLISSLARARNRTPLRRAHVQRQLCFDILALAAGLRACVMLDYAGGTPHSHVLDLLHSLQTSQVLPRGALDHVRAFHMGGCMYLVNTYWIHHSIHTHGPLSLTLCPLLPAATSASADPTPVQRGGPLRPATSLSFLRLRSTGDAQPALTSEAAGAMSALVTFAARLLEALGEGAHAPSAMPRLANQSSGASGCEAGRERREHSSGGRSTGTACVPGMNGGGAASTGTACIPDRGGAASTGTTFVPQRGEASSGATTLVPCSMDEALEECAVLLPTVNGWLLGYPVVYLFPRSDHRPQSQQQPRSQSQEANSAVPQVPASALQVFQILLPSMKGVPTPDPSPTLGGRKLSLLTREDRQPQGPCFTLPGSQAPGALTAQPQDVLLSFSVPEKLCSGEAVRQWGDSLVSSLESSLELIDAALGLPFASSVWSGKASVEASRPPDNGALITF